MIAKLIVWAPTREQAIQKMKRALDDYLIEGIETTIDFGNFVMNHPDFIKGEYDTHFVKKNYDPKKIMEEQREENRVKALMVLKLFKHIEKKLNVVRNELSHWHTNRS